MSEPLYPAEMRAKDGSVRMRGTLRFLDPTMIPGARWYDGGGPPSDSYGVDGDYYLDDDTGTVYRKDGGTWA